ncbi:VOC family protein, partial [Escherichia coli]|nr:VOC family protein [Escherichia coli]
QAKAEAGGGKLVWGPHEVPGGEWVINITDPEGVSVGLVSPNKS